MKTQNKKYYFILIGILLFFGVFLTSKTWMPDDRSLRVQNYNQVVTINDWEVKVSDAKYDAATKTMTFQLYERTTREGQNEPAISYYLGKKSTSKKPLESSAEPVELQNTDNGAKALEGYAVTIHNVPKDYWYVSVNLECESNTAQQITDSTDVFGQPNTGSVNNTTPKKRTAVVQIDYRKAAAKGA